MNNNEKIVPLSGTISIRVGYLLEKAYPTMRLHQKIAFKMGRLLKLW